MLVYFYITLCATFLPPIIVDRHWFRSITAFNTYIKYLPRKKIAFLVELQDLEFISEVVRIITKVRSNFANEVKKRGN